jgi:hypothetical protein
MACDSSEVLRVVSPEDDLRVSWLSGVSYKEAAELEGDIDNLGRSEKIFGTVV